jgi:hypothetical protein
MQKVLDVIWGAWPQKYFSENQKKDSTQKCLTGKSPARQAPRHHLVIHRAASRRRPALRAASVPEHLALAFHPDYAAIGSSTQDGLSLRNPSSP